LFNKESADGEGCQWVFGTQSTYGGLKVHLIDNGQWAHYEFSFVWNRDLLNVNDDVVHIMLEDFEGSGRTAGDAYFDNVEFAAVVPPAVVPEASSCLTWLVLTACAFGYGWWRKRRPV